MKWRYNCQRYH